MQANLIVTGKKTQGKQKEEKQVKQNNNVQGKLLQANLTETTAKDNLTETG